MKCPFCKSTETQVRDSRLAEEGNVVRRRRFCEKCSAKFSTYEKAKLKEIFVVKRSGVRKPFDKSKIHSSIATAMRKRKNDEQQVENIVSIICANLENIRGNDIPTRKIGDMILQELAKYDEVAYIRFASVYKDFMSAQDFAKFINTKIDK